jgi:2-dehydropantoate 2-reductase
MKVVVIGAGAMGCAIGAHLHDGGNEVAFVDASPELIEVVRRDGVTVETPEKRYEWRPDITADPSTLDTADLVIVMVKGTVTAPAIAAALPVIGPDTVVLSLQNGWGGGTTIAEYVDARQVVIGVTYSSSTVVGAGRYRQTGRGATFVGPLSKDGSAEFAQRAGDALTASGWETDVTTDVATQIWKKLILNAATLPTAALTLLNAGSLAGPATLPVVNDVAREAVAVAQAIGLDIQLDERLASIESTLRKAGKGEASMLQDVKARRRTEIATINGAVVRAGDGAGVPVPLNRALVALIQGLESGWTE